MTIELQMPALSNSSDKGTVSRWLKTEGDRVDSGEVIAEIESEKATFELQAPAKGILGTILVQAGTAEIASGTPIGLLLTPEDNEPPREQAFKERGSSRTIASPAARAAAGRSGIDIRSLRGSGPGGRIILQDVNAAALERTGASSTAAELHRIEPSDLAPWEDIPTSAMRKTLAQRLTASKQTIPHFYAGIQVELDELIGLRTRLNEVMPEKLSINDFLIKALSVALRRHPDANIQFNGDTLRRFKRVDIAVAVAVTGGVMAPVIRGADTKTLTAICAESRALAGKARAGTLPATDCQGGTFSLSNLGMYGVTEFLPIINPPQAGILAAGAAQPAVVSRDGSLRSATVLALTAAFDHRVIDGALGAKLLVTLKTLLENPFALLVD